jgi:hypothetical protein
MDAAAGDTAAGSDGDTAAGSDGPAGDAPLTMCPKSQPLPGGACSGSFQCDYVTSCNCSTCCSMAYKCANGKIAILGFNDGCTQPQACPDAAADRPSDAAADGAADAMPDVTADAMTDAVQPVCSPGINQTCNDNPAVSSFRGRCTDAGTCVCNNDAAPLPASGRCL